MPLLPKVLTSFGSADSAAARTLANVKTAVDPALSFLNNTFAVGSDNALSFLRRIKVFAADKVTTTLLQATTVAATTVSATTATAATGTFTQRVIASTNGFKTYVPMGYYFNSSYTVATGYVQTVNYLVATGGTSYQAPLFSGMPFNGSIVGITALYYGQAGSIGCNVQIRGGATTPTYSFTAIGQPYTSQVSYARGLYPFTIAQSLSAYVSFGTAGNNLLYVGAIVEWDT